MKTILVIDDDFQIRNLLRETFSNEGFIVLTADNGDKALKTLSQVNVDLAIVDMIMPNKDGIETISGIANTYPEIKIIAVSGGSTSLNASLLTEMAIKVGAGYALKKPFDLFEISDKVKNLLGFKQSDSSVLQYLV